jgi:hypothetical protein
LAIRPAQTKREPQANNARALSEFDYDNGDNNFDVRHTFNLSALFDLPFGKGKKTDLGTLGNALLGDWEVGTILNGRSGLPLEIGIVRPRRRHSVPEGRGLHSADRNRRRHYHFRQWLRRSTAGHD